MTTTAFRLRKVSDSSRTQVSGALTAQTVSNISIRQIVAYTPTEFSTAIAGGLNAVTNFMTRPGQAQATTAAGGTNGGRATMGKLAAAAQAYRQGEARAGHIA